jgi:hypothetical protein
LKLEGNLKGEPGGVDPVHDETELESITSDDGANDILPDLKVDSEAREGEDDDAVTEASDSDDELVKKTRRAERTSTWQV